MNTYLQVKQKSMRKENHPTCTWSYTKIIIKTNCHAVSYEKGIFCQNFMLAFYIIVIDVIIVMSYRYYYIVVILYYFNLF